VSLEGWIRYRQAGYEPAAHHRLLIEHLEAVERGEIDRLMVCMPPGSAKSTYTSVEFPPWFLGRNPQQNVIAASHTQELAETFGRRARNVVASDEYGAVFGFGLNMDSQAAGRWATERGGEYFAAGVGGAIAGRRADLVVIDDPVKSQEDADSERARARAWDWYVSDLLTRLKPGGRQILVMTRWHEEDLGGKILEREGSRWVVLEIPMEAYAGDPLGRAPGEMLWPDYFTPDMVAAAKLNPRSWNALYQQRPSPEDGTYFKRDWFKTWVAKPAHLNIYGSSDYAVTDSGGDFTVHRVWGVDAQGDLYRLDGWRGQTTADVWIERKLDLIARYQPFAWFGESGVIQKAVEPMLTRRMRERNVYCRMEWLPSITDKPTRSRGFQARAASGRVYFEPGADIDEFLKFPAGKNDDDVDTASLIGRALDDAHPAIVPAKPKQTHVDRWDRAFNEDESSDWKTA
jgi:predicted phage terminase large subunit-like protein